MSATDSSTEVAQIFGELDAILKEQPDSLTVIADFDNLRAAIARRSMEMARSLDENPALFEAVRKIVQAFFIYCNIHQLDAEHVDVNGIMTPTGRVVVSFNPL